MKKITDEEIDESVKKNCNKFIEHIESDIHFISNYSGDSMSDDWIDQIESACPFIDNVVRKPKLALIKEENVLKTEKAKKITVASVKDLSRHTNYISKIDKVTNEIQPSKILDIRNEETYNIYENRFLYTLIQDLDKFLYEKEEQLKNFELRDEKNIEYSGKTNTSNERVEIELKINSISLPKEADNMGMKDEIQELLIRIKRIKEFLTSWKHSEMYKSLEKMHIVTISPPLKPTNIILKNPNFQIAVKLWSFILSSYKNESNEADNNLDISKNEKLKGLVDHSFLIDYIVLESFSKKQKDQKEKLRKYAILMITEEISRVLSLLLACGIKLSEQELMELIAKELKNKKKNDNIGNDEIKQKFKSAIDEYLERIQDSL